MPLKIVPWRTWGKDEPRWVKESSAASRYVFFVNSNTRPCFDGHLCIGQAKYIQRLHTRRGKSECPDVRFNFLIGGDGNVYEGRGWLVRPALPQRYTMVNGAALSIAFIGTFLETEPPSAMFEAREELIIFGVKHHYIAPRHLQFCLPSLEPTSSFE